MADVVAFLFVCACVGGALWATIRGRAHAGGCGGDCSACGAGCAHGSGLELSAAQLAQIQRAKETCLDTSR